MACGRPVLTSNVSSAKDAICKPEYGCVVDPCTSEAFASALLDASSREYDEHLIRQYAEEHSWEKWAQSTMLIFDEIGTTSPIQHQ
jgi:glycosyltransferase involved in cell wall biosynthesis